MTSKEYLFKVGDKVVLKENLLIVEIVKLGKKNEYEVFYPHLKEKNTFWVKENELQEKPYDYNEKIFMAYIEYRVKYYDLLKRLYSPSVRDKY